ncbi:hypothetical protein N7478_011853 [Penicillium angulare]|uniref:uncharacterized protein n=1 Tax=Penicillium angulare TaxID=116970 RepID=UPI002542257B|nr:uncharacterized protein N7478_011853 [Penicillium angulare]KAJ5261258.1 hypothetical protein N7478_011853 [Penicillium angulare]
MPPDNAPYHEYKKDWPPELIRRLRATYVGRPTTPHYVSVFMHAISGPATDPEFIILGVFASNFLANRTAIEFFKNEYSEFLNQDSDNPLADFRQIEPHDPSCLEMNEIGWSVFDRGELSFVVFDGGDENKLRVFVKLAVIHSSYQQDIAESGYDLRITT